MFKARIPFMSGHTMYRAGDQVPGDHPNLTKLIDKGLVIEIKVDKPAETKQRKPRRTRARKNDNLPESKTK